MRTVQNKHNKFRKITLFVLYISCVQSLESAYRPTYHWWELLISAHRLIFTYGALVPLVHQTRALVLVVVSLVALLLHAMCRPFRSKLDHWMGLLCHSAVVTAAGTYFMREAVLIDTASEDPRGGQVDFYFTVVNLIAVAIPLSVMAGYVAYLACKSGMQVASRLRGRGTHSLTGIKELDAPSLEMQQALERAPLLSSMELDELNIDADTILRRKETDDS